MSAAEETVECKDCGETVEPSPTISRDPRTGRDKRQWICPECGAYLGGSGRFV